MGAKRDTAGRTGPSGGSSRPGGGASGRGFDRPAASWTRLGMLTPSSNSVLEPYTARMLAPFGDAVTAHFSRFPVVEISLSDASRGQFAPEPILAAARLLADAKVDVIAWNGTSASWLGFAGDEALCRAITAETGVPATSTVLALNETLARLGARTMGLVTPYVSEVQARIVANYAGIGIRVVAESRLEDRGNFTFAEHSEQVIESMIRDVARARPDAIAVVCTNFRGAPLVARLEGELDITILDSVAVTACAALAKAGIDPSRVVGWGRVFQRTRALPGATVLSAGTAEGGAPIAG